MVTLIWNLEILCGAFNNVGKNGENIQKRYYVIIYIDNVASQVVVETNFPKSTIDN